MSQMMARVTRVTVPSLERAPEKAAVCQKAAVRRSFITTTVREQRPTSHLKGATGRVSSSMPLPTWTRHPDKAPPPACSGSTLELNFESIMRVVKPGLGNSLVLIHHRNSTLSLPGPVRLPGPEGRDVPSRPAKARGRV